MVPTIFGLIVIGVCLLMLILKRPLREFVAGLIISGVFGAAEAVSLPALGGASLTVPYFFVFFLVLRLLLTAQKRPSLVSAALGANLWLVIFALYGVWGSLILPRLFEGAMAVVAMRPLPYPTLLTFTSQNITQAFYLVLTTLTALAAYTAARLPKAEETFLLGWTIAASLFVLCGLIDLVGFYSTGADLLSFMKTASYAMLSQAESGVRRISGSFTEPSGFAGFGAAPLLLFLYLWLVDVRSTRFGLLGAAVAVLLALSTSSTAFAMIAVCFAMLLVGGAIAPMKTRVRQRKFVTMFGAILFCIFAGAVLVMIMPKFASTFADIAHNATIGKAKSASAIERGSWAAQGPEAFRISKGLGIGAGSFRSSGLFQSILGSLGIIGTFAFCMFLLKLAQVWMKKIPNADRRVVIACTGSAILMLVAPTLTSPGPDPGILFAVLAGFALGRQKQLSVESRAQAAAFMNAGPDTTIIHAVPAVPRRV